MPRRKKRVGLDVFVNGKKWGRCAPPDGGAFTAMIGNLPSLQEPARAFLMASNYQESWNWQFPDLNVGDKITFKIVKTDWCSEPGSIEEGIKGNAREQLVPKKP